MFEVPTGVIADTRGRRFSFLLGAATLLVSTLLYLVMWQIHASFVGWALASIVLGLGFTFFSGATEAWLVDALHATGFAGDLESVFGRAQTVSGAAMLVGSVLGGVVAQATDLGVPYVLRAVMLGVTLVVAFRFMHDIGFKPRKGASPVAEVRSVLRGSIDAGWRNPPVRWLMLAAPFTSGVGFYAFYALQPYLLELYGDAGAYGVAGLAAAIFAGAQILGGLMVPRVRRLFTRRTDALLIGGAINVGLLVLIGLTSELRRRAGAAHRLGAGLRGRRSAPAGLHQRVHPVGATSHGPVVRLAHGLDRRRRHPADPRAGRRRLRLRAVLPRLGRLQRPVAAVHLCSRVASARRRT